MSDENKVDRAVVALVDDKGNAIGRAAKTRSPIAPRIRQPGNPLHDLVSREEMINGASNAAIALGQKMYDQFSQETVEYLEAFEQEFRAEMQAFIDRRLWERSWRGRLWARWQRFLGAAARRGWYTPKPVEPLALVDAVDVLDPNVPREGQDG